MRPMIIEDQDAGDVLMAVDRNILPVLNRNYCKGRVHLCTPGASVPYTQSTCTMRDDEGAR